MARSSPEHMATIASGVIHRGRFAGQPIASLSSKQLRGIVDKGRRPGRQNAGTRAALFAAIETELEKRSRGESAEPESPAVPAKAQRIFKSRLEGKDRKGDSYGSRNQFLRTLGFENYAEYLKSSLWQKVREKVFRLKGRKCYLCGKYATQAHHNRYHRNDLLGIIVRHIHPVCGECHAAIEFNCDGKSSVLQVRSEFNKRRRTQKKRSRESVKD